MTTAEAAPSRDAIDEKHRWNLADIFADWNAWEQALTEFGGKIEVFAALRGTIGRGQSELLHAFRLGDELGQLAYKLWYFAALRYDENQRDNEANARRQQVQILFARWKQDAAWFDPELLRVPLETVQHWMAAGPDDALAVYRFAIEDLYRQQADRKSVV